MKKLYRLFVVMALLCVSLNSYAQIDRLSMTLLPHSPFTNLTNPGIRVNYNGLVGLGISNIDASLYNSSFLSNNIYRYEGSTAVAIDGVKFVNSLQEQGNKFASEFSIDLINAGFRANKWFFNFDFKLKMDAFIEYSKDFVGFFLMGNSYYMDDNPADFNIGMENTCYKEASVAVQYNVNEKLTVGIRPKFLIGVGNSILTNERTKIYTDSDTYAMSADINFEIRGASILSEDFKRISDITNLDFTNTTLKQLLGVGDCYGFGLDLGAEYVFNKHWGVSAGMYDLGFIKWRNSKMKTKVSTGTVVYDVVFNDVNKIESLDVNYDAVVSAMVNRVWGNDSLVDGGDYKTYLKTKFQVMGFYEYNEMVRGTVMAQTYVYGGKLYPSITAAYSGTFFNCLDLTLNYTYSSYTKSSVGAGIGVHAGVFNMYLTTDNILILTKLGKPTPEIISAYNAVNFRFGIVFTLGKYQNLKSRFEGDKVESQNLN